MSSKTCGRLTGWRLEWLGNHLERWRDEIAWETRYGNRPPGWLARERELIHEYETIYLDSRYPTVPRSVSEGARDE